MGLNDQARKDLQAFTSDSNGWGEPIRLTSPNGASSIDLTGLTSKHHLGIDSEGNLKNVKKAHCSFSEQLCIDASFVIRDNGGNVDLAGYFATFKDSRGVDVIYKIREWFPDETLGFIACILGTYKGSISCVATVLVDDLTFTVTGGNPSYTYELFDGETLLDTLVSASNVYVKADLPVSAGYVVKVTDSLGQTCQSAFEVVLNQKFILTPFNSGVVGLLDYGTSVYSDGVAHGQGGLAFLAGYKISDTKIVFRPFNSVDIGVYNPVANTYFGVAHGEATSFYFIHSLQVGSKIVMMPQGGNNIGVFESNTDTYTSVTHGQGVNPFRQGLELSNGNVLALPRDSANVGYVDLTTDLFVVGNAHGQPASAFISAIETDGVNVIMLPDSSAFFGKYNSTTNTYTNGAANTKGTKPFIDAVKMDDGSLVLSPNGSANIGLYNATTDTYTDGATHGMGSSAFNKAYKISETLVILIPDDSLSFGRYNPSTDTFTAGAAHGLGVVSIIGSYINADNQVIITRADGVIYKYDVDADTFGVLVDTLKGVNAFGQIIKL